MNIFIHYYIFATFFFIETFGQDVDFQCPEDAPPDGLYPHLNCSMFISCVNGESSIHECGKNLYFNPSFDGCDFPSNVPECKGGTRPPPSATITPTTSTITSPVTTPSTTVQLKTIPSTTVQLTTIPTTTVLLTTIPTTTPTPTTKLTTTPTPTTKLTTTPTPTTKLTTTPTPTTKLTTPRTTTKLTTTPNTTKLTTTPTTNKLATYQFNTTEAKTTTKPPIIKCPSTGIVNIQYPGNCSMFVLCVDEIAIVSRCKNETLFDPIGLKCKGAEDVDCQAVVPIEFSPPVISSPYYCPEDIEFILMPVKEECGYFYVCSYGKYEITQYCNYSHWFNFEKQTCTPKERTKCARET